MPAITDRSAKQSTINVKRLGHGTVECSDIAKTRRFYEEVLGLEVIQASLFSLIFRLGTEHTYVLVETGRDSADREMNLMNHNGLDVGTPEEVDKAYAFLMEIKDEWGLRKIQEPRHLHGDTAFYFCDFDGNWWEILSVRDGGYARDFDEPEWDLTGRYEFDDEKGSANFIHTHDPEFRARITSRE